MKARFVVAIALVAAFACGGAMCVTNPTTGQKTLSPQSQQTVSTIQAAVNWAVPVAAGIIGMVGNPQEKADMSMAAASVGELNAVAASAQGTGSAAQQAAADSAFQQAFQALDSVITAKPGATAQVATIPATVQATKAVVTPAPAPASAANPGVAPAVPTTSTPGK